MFRDCPVNPFFFFVLIALHLTVPAVFFLEFKAYYLWFFVLAFFWFSLSSSLYYHRFLAHRCCDLNIIVELFFLVGGLIGFSGDPVYWASFHRFHHKYPDTPGDPHSPKHGLLWSYYGWYIRLNEKKLDEIKHYAEDLNKKWHIRWASKLWVQFLVHTSFALLLLSIGGVSLLVWGLYLPMLLSFNSAWALITSLCHIPKLGYERFPRNERSRNLAWLAPFTFGEALHNNHHVHPSRASTSFSWYEVDLTGCTFFLLKKMKLARNFRGYS